MLNEIVIFFSYSVFLHRFKFVVPQACTDDERCDRAALFSMVELLVILYLPCILCLSVSKVADGEFSHD